MKGFKDSVSVATPSNHPLPLSHQVNTSFDFYQFRPVFCEEMYPSDHMKVSVRDYFRASPMAGAVYGNMYKKYSAFFVPYRILWKDWNDYLTGGSNGRLEFDFPHFTMSDLVNIAVSLQNAVAGAFQPETIEEYRHVASIYRNMIDFWSDLGMPIDILFSTDFETPLDTDDYNEDIDAFDIPLIRFAAARRVWFDWYRDQNIIGDDVEDEYCPKDIAGSYSPTFDPSDYSHFSPEKNNLLSPMPVCVEKDYFTTMMTEPQRGGAAFVPVQLPSSDLNPNMSGEGSARVIGVDTSGHVGKINVDNSSASYPGFNGIFYSTTQSNIIGMFDYNSTRVAKAVQKFCEKNNIAGGADLQQLLAHWGTAPNPAVFQKSTYIGSFMDSVNLSEVVSPSDVGDSAAGEVSTRMNSAARGQFEYTANEHGFFMIVMIARPENTYVGGIAREVLHGCLGNGRFDFYTPEMEKTGFQPAYNYEKTSRVFLAKNAGEDFTIDGTCGFVPRYAETKRKYNKFTGQMATHLYQSLRIVRDFNVIEQLSDNDLFINGDFTMVYGYPASLPYDRFFKVENPLLDHFDGWIKFDVEVDTPRCEYSAPLIEDVKGDDVQLPYAGVRM